MSGESRVEYGHEVVSVAFPFIESLFRYFVCVFESGYECRGRWVVQQCSLDRVCVVFLSFEAVGGWVEVVVYAFGAALEDAVVRYRCPGIGLFACVQQCEEGGVLASEPLFVGHAVTSSLVKAYRTVMFTSVSAHVCIRPLHVTNRHVSSGSSSMISASMASSCRLGMALAMSRPRLAVSRCV